MVEVMAWLRVVALGVVKWPLKIVAPLAVLFVDRRDHPVFGVRDAVDLSWWNVGVRNGVHNFLNRPMPEWLTVATNTPWDPSLELEEGLQWRYRIGGGGEYVSFRMTWGSPRGKGKREFYVGWTMNSEPYMRLTFFQLRVF